mmetsp:Transcript_72425/g.160005  ORF Transcript_72425/g.160005 Transcript_72425/m.160005 type:complete len:251 (-) Transcript_72425:9-761(-)
MPREVTPRRTSVGASVKAREEEAQLQVTRLRQALDAKKRRLERAAEELDKLRATCNDLKAQHDAERPSLESELAELREQNRQLQASSSGHWKTTRRIQSSLRKAEERSEVQVEEYLARQRNLEQQNLRLRKALAALKSQLFGWKHRRKGLTMPRCQPPVVVVTSQEPTASSATSANPEGATRPDSRQRSLTPPRSLTPGRPARRSVTPRRPSEQALREDVRLAEEKAKQAQAELASAKARLLALQQRPGA